MPHATLPSTGFQAFILCGPGENLAPFNSNPKDFPKALIPIANRPMIWYPLDWCGRMGVTDIYLIASPESRPALEAALAQNPYLTQPTLPTPEIISPEDLTLTTGTAELFRFPKVQKAIKGDFIVLPCDIVCELHGSSLLETWMTLQAGLGGARSIDGVLSAEQSGRRGGLGVWYQTKDAAEGGVGVKKEETDFIATTEIAQPAVPSASGSLRPFVRDLKVSMPTAVLKDKMEEEKSLRIRHALLRKHGKVKMMTTYRDAHIYFFPHWVKDMMAENETFDNISEDVVGWWAKSTWQDGLPEKLQMGEALASKKKKVNTQLNGHLDDADDEIDLAGLSSTGVLRPAQSQSQSTNTTSSRNSPSPYASRVRILSPTSSSPSPHPQPPPITTIPPILSYLHPSHPPSHLIRRVDTVPLLLNVSLALAKLPSTSDPSNSGATSTTTPLTSFSHTHKIHPTSTTPPQMTMPQTTSLVDANVTLFSKSTIKECVIGASCVLGGEKAGVRLNRCVLMDGAVVEAGGKLDGCVLGRRCRIGADCELRDCYVQEGFVVPPGTTAKGEVLQAGVEGTDLSGDEDGDGEEEEEEEEGEMDGDEEED